MAVDFNTIQGLVKRVYSDQEIENLQNMDTLTWDKISKSPKKPTGDGFYGPVTVAGNQKGLGAQNELEALRTAGNQDPQQFRIRPKIITQVNQFSGLSLDLAKGNEDSFADNLTYQMDEGLRDSKKELNQQLFRDGSGVIALVNGTSAGTTVTFDNGVPTHFREGMEIDIITGAGTKETSAVTVSAVDIANNQITVSANSTATDNSSIYRAGVGDNAPADGKELAGLPLVTDDGTLAATYQNISRTTYPKWDGITIDAGGANLSNDSLQQAISRIKVIAGRKPNKVVSNTSQFRNYLDVVTPLKRFDRKGKMDSGYEEVPTWNGMEWIEDTDCGFGDVYLINTEYVSKYVVRDLHFDATDGNILKWNNGYDGCIAYSKFYGNVGSNVPNAHVRLTNLAVPTF